MSRIVESRETTNQPEPLAPLVLSQIIETYQKELGPSLYEVFVAYDKGAQVTLFYLKKGLKEGLVGPYVELFNPYSYNESSHADPLCGPYDTRNKLTIKIPPLHPIYNPNYDKSPYDPPVREVKIVAEGVPEVPRVPRVPEVPAKQKHLAVICEFLLRRKEPFSRPREKSDFPGLSESMLWDFVNRSDRYFMPHPNQPRQMSQEELRESFEFIAQSFLKKLQHQ